MKAVLLIVLLSVSPCGSVDRTVRDNNQHGMLTVRLAGFKHDRGTAMVALTNAQGFLAHTGALRAESVAIRDGQAVCIFKEVPYGAYAVQAYHDENGNKHLDTNFLGIPTEPYGFSNDARGLFGPPRYEDAEFRFSAAAMTIEIRVR